MNLTDEAKCKQIIEHYGFDMQMNVLAEECAELIQAIMKMKRVKALDGSAEKVNEADKHFIEELADVYIMIMQMRTYLVSSSHELFDKTVTEKLDRQLQRIEQAKQKAIEDYQKWRSGVQV